MSTTIANTITLALLFLLLLRLLYCTVLSCPVLCCTVVYYTVIYSFTSLPYNHSLLYSIMLRTSYSVMFYHIMSYCIVLHHMTSHPIASLHFTSRHITSLHFTSHHITPLHIASRRITSRRIIRHAPSSLWDHTGLYNRRELGGPLLARGPLRTGATRQAYAPSFCLHMSNDD